MLLNHIITYQGVYPRIENLLQRFCCGQFFTYFKSKSISRMAARQRSRATHHEKQKVNEDLFRQL